MAHVHGAWCVQVYDTPFHARSNRCISMHLHKVQTLLLLAIVSLLRSKACSQCP